MGRAHLAIGVALSVALATAANAAARKPPPVPPGMASVAQYIETLPTSSGPKVFSAAQGATPTSSGSSRPVTTSAAAAPSSSSHAGSRKLRRSRHARKPHRTTSPPARHMASPLDRLHAPNVLSAAGSSLGGFSVNALLLLAVVVASLAFALRQRRRAG